MTEISNQHNSLDQFLEQRCECSGDYEVAKGIFYSIYSGFVIARGEVPLLINEVGRIMKTKPFVEDARTKNLRIWKGIQVLDLQAAEQTIDANLARTPNTSASLQEMKTLLVDEPKVVLPHTITPKDDLLRNDPVNILLLRNMMGLVGIPRF